MHHIQSNKKITTPNDSFFAVLYLGINRITDKKIKNVFKNSTIFRRLKAYYNGPGCMYSLQIANKTEELLEKFKHDYPSAELDNLLALMNREKHIKDLQDRELTSLYNYIYIMSDMIGFIGITNVNYDRVLEAIKDNFENRYFRSSKFLYSGKKNEAFLKLLITNINKGVIKKEEITSEMLYYFEQAFATYKQQNYGQKPFQIYRDLLKNIGIGKSLGLPVEIYSNEISFLSDAITPDSEFEKKYGHKFDYIDMMLTTTLKMDDIQKVYKREHTNVMEFIKGEYRKAFQFTAHFSTQFAKFYENHTSCQEFFEDLDAQSKTPETSLDFTKEDYDTAKKYLLRLNYRYGVPVTKIALVNMIYAVKGGYYSKYFEVARDFKGTLDEYSEINEFSNPFMRFRKSK